VFLADTPWVTPAYSIVKIIGFVLTGRFDLFNVYRRHIFGHSSSQYTAGWSRLGKLQVQWDTSSWEHSSSSSSEEAE
jgi:hypothetical protein